MAGAFQALIIRAKKELPHSRSLGEQTDLGRKRFVRYGTGPEVPVGHSIRGFCASQESE